VSPSGAGVLINTAGVTFREAERKDGNTSPDSESGLRGADKSTGREKRRQVAALQDAGTMA